MKINIKQLKQSLTLTDIETIITSLNIPITMKTTHMWHLKSGCHSEDCDCDSNLKFYTETMTFTCFSHGCLIGNDILDLISTRMLLFNDNWTFVDTLNYIIKVLNLNISELKFKSEPKFNYTKFFNKYLNHSADDIVLTNYDDWILLYFDKGLYHQNFLNDGIDVKTMQKFEVGYYDVKQQITLPVRDIDGDLVGIRVRNLIPEMVVSNKYMPLTLLNGFTYKFPTNQVFYGIYQNAANIRKSRTAILVESEKSVMQFEQILENNIALGLFGLHMSVQKRATLLELNVTKVIIAVDKDYVKIPSNEYDTFKNNVFKIYEYLKGYFDVEVIIDEDSLLEYKDSPSDKGKEVWSELYRNRKNINDI